VVAKSFARIFFRNAVNIGLPVFECPEAAQHAWMGDEMQVDPSTGIIQNLTRGETYQAAPFPEFMQGIISAGGLVGYIQSKREQA
jgi:3-isopropylmalate/(R)-2-methylmalate dehydratase small subunit